MIQFDNCFNYFHKKFFSYLNAEKYEINKNVLWIAGGAVRDYFSSSMKKTDIDIFCVSGTVFKNICDDIQEKGGIQVYENENTIRYLLNKINIDVVKKFFDTPIDCINSFDFTVSMFACGYNGEIFYGTTSFIDLAKKQIMINKITYPLSTLHRLLKYQNKGFRICKGELFKIAVSINEMTDLVIKDEKIEENISLSDIIMDIS